MNRIASEFGVFGNYSINDVDVIVSFSKSGLKETINKNINAAQLASLIPILKETVENAIGIEAHSNRYFYDTETVQFKNLFGGYFDGEYFVPVRFGLKYSKNNKPVLYVVMCQKKMKVAGYKGRVPIKLSVADTPAATNISVSDIIPFVNTKSKDLLRFFPDGMLNEEQKKAKWEAVSEAISKTNDKNDEKYRKYLKEGDLIRAKNMVTAAAKANGYTIKAYHGTNSEFTVFDKEKIKIDNLGRGFYFSDSKDIANSYAERRVEERGGEKTQDLFCLAL